MQWKKHYLPNTYCEYARTAKAYAAIFIFAAFCFYVLLLPMTDRTRKSISDETLL